jgi:hypothetical protein
MSNQSELNSYIAGLQQRLRLGSWLRGAAIFTGTALFVTIALVLVLNRFAFPAHGVNAARLAMLAALAAAAVFGLALPLIRETRSWAVRNAEAANPELQQRLTTFQERENSGDDPFLELLAADTLARTRQINPSSLVSENRLFALGGAGFACLGVLVWMIAAGPGYLGYGASLLWTNRNAAPLYTVVVTPGDITVRRNSDQLITAHITGMHPDKARLFAHYQSAAGWEPVMMQAGPDSGTGATYQFVFAGLPENVEYYVTTGPLVSSHYKVRVVDLPSVKELSVTYHYPGWTGMKPTTEEHSGDLRAIEGTDAAIELQMDRPLKDGQLVLDDGRKIQLTGGAGNSYHGSIHLEKDGAYYVADTDEAQQVRLSEDYFIATDKAVPPEVAIDRPGGDYRASPIEEVTVAVKARDQFALNDVHLHYSVNGGPNRDVSLLKSLGAKSMDGSYTLPLEDYKLAPGDLVSLYATAKDGHSEARTDISFIQVDRFEREFSQSQQSGGGGGSAGSGSNNQTEISKREKELIAATWKQQNDRTATPKDAAAAGQFLSEAQRKLRDQVTALSVRMQSRDISQANEEFTDFDKDMQAAASAMAPSAEKLKDMQWKGALPLEQKALQALLRAEATFRKIEVAFGQTGGGGAGGGSSGRDLASLFDLELDTEKNQYETGRTASPADQHEKDVEDALAKLDALAKRQEDLANQQHNPQQSFQERWQQEMLRREAEQLQRQMEQLAHDGQQGANGSNSAQQNSQQQSSSSQSASAGQRGSQSSHQQGGDQSPSPSANQSGEQRIEEALKRLRQATDAMKRSSGPQQSAQAGQQAADELRQATNLLAGTQQQLASGRVGSLSRGAERLAQEERGQADRINKFASQQTNNPSATDMDGMIARLRERDRLAQERQQLSDDLSKLQKNMRDAAREMVPTQPGAAQKLRDALTQMEESDLDNHMQRTADWLRRGINPNSNGTESEIAQGLAKLNEQLREAEKRVGQGSPGQRGSEQSSQTAALHQVERLRRELEAMEASRGNNGQAGRSGQSQKGQDSQRGGATGTAGAGKRGDDGTQIDADVAGRSGDVHNGGGGVSDGTVWDNINTGNNRYGHPPQQSAPSGASANLPDTERSYQLGMRELNQLRQMVKDDPRAAKEVAELARQVQQLDPKRFLRNPEMVEQLHREVLSAVDKLELQLQRDGAASQARTGKSYTIPPGYQESVAEYYKGLTKNP